MDSRQSLREYISTYFNPICAGQLTGYFLALGLTKVRQEDIRTTWIGRTAFVDISHMPETSPDYEIQVFVGIGDQRFDANGNWQCVPLWALMPREQEAKIAEVLRFNSESQLRLVLEQCRSTYFPLYIEPQLKNHVELQREITRFSSRS